MARRLTEQVWGGAAPPPQNSYLRHLSRSAVS